MRNMVTFIRLGVLCGKRVPPPSKKLADMCALYAGDNWTCSNCFKTPYDPVGTNKCKANGCKREYAIYIVRVVFMYSYKFWFTCVTWLLMWLFLKKVLH